MPALFKNNAVTTLGSSILSTDTSMSVASGTGALFPTTTSGYFHAALVNSLNQVEYVKVTSRTSDTFTIVRAQDGTTARAYTAGDKVELRLINAALENFVQLDGAQTITGNKTFSGNNTLSGNNTFSGTSTFSGTIALSGTIDGIIPVTNGGSGSSTATGTGDNVLSTSPTLTTPTLSTPTLSNPSNSTPGSIKALFETTTITAAAPSSTTNFDIKTQAVQYYTTNNSANFTVNLRGDGSTTLNSMLSVGQSVTATLLVTNGSTAYYPTAFQVDGASVTPKWQNGSAPTSGNINSIDSYTFAIVKTANATFTVLASKVKYA